jgi:hypothetical protein
LVDRKKKNIVKIYRTWGFIVVKGSLWRFPHYTKGTHINLNDESGIKLHSPHYISVIVLNKQNKEIFKIFKIICFILLCTLLSAKREEF